VTADLVIGGRDGQSLARLALPLANRHGLIAGATGTGKTVTLRVLAEGFSAAGVPVVLADVKGDLGALGEAGKAESKFESRAREVGLGAWAPAGRPVAYWDVFGEQGTPLRATISDMGPLLLARLLDLNETQAAVLALVFKVADDRGLLLLDLKDLRAMLAEVADKAKDLAKTYGTVSTASVGAIQRALLALEQQGADRFFGEPSLALADLMRIENGQGVVNLIAADKLMRSPRLYATFLLWLLSELFEDLPEMGDLDKPRLVFFFDEAHLLFDDAPKALVDKVEQVVRLIRSKGVGIYFVTQSPLDLPEDVLGQLGNRVQHALRAFTPRDQKAVRVAAETFRPNPRLDTAAVIGELGIGEALVSCLDLKGMPQPVERVLIAPPVTRLGPLAPEERKTRIAGSPMQARYATPIDRESAYERLTGRVAPVTGKASTVPQAGGDLRRVPEKLDDPGPRPAPRDYKPRGRAPDTLIETGAKSVARSIGAAIGREIVRGVLGSILKRR